MREALDHVAKRYFEGSRLLVNEEHKTLAGRCDFWRVLLKQFNDLVLAEFERGTDDASTVERLSLTDIEEAGRALAPDGRPTWSN